MITVNEIGSAVYGAYRLARGDPGGMAFFDRTPDGALKSFYAAALLLPIYALLTAIDEWTFIKTASLPRLIVLEAIMYVIGWTIVPLLMLWITHWIDRWSRYCDFVVAYNWSNVIMMALWTPLQALRLAELLPMPLFYILGFGVLGAVLLYLWYIFKVSLEVSGGMAAGLVTGEYILGLLLFRIGRNVIYGE